MLRQRNCLLKQNKTQQLNKKQSINNINNKNVFHQNLVNHQIRFRTTTTMNHQQRQCLSSHRNITQLSSPLSYETIMSSNISPISHFSSNISKLQTFKFQKMKYSTEEVSEDLYHEKADETLDILNDAFDELLESNIIPESEDPDVEYAYGILTVKLGNSYGTYVINKQAPNKQIWLSSPVSGPCRYDYDIEKDDWIYSHDGHSLFDLLQNEVQKLLNTKISFK